MADICDLWVHFIEGIFCMWMGSSISETEPKNESVMPSSPSSRRESSFEEEVMSSSKFFEAEAVLILSSGLEFSLFSVVFIFIGI